MKDLKKACLNVFPIAEYAYTTIPTYIPIETLTNIDTHLGKLDSWYAAKMPPEMFLCHFVRGMKKKRKSYVVTTTKRFTEPPLYYQHGFETL
jgi:hypothetical protein